MSDMSDLSREAFEKYKLTYKYSDLFIKSKAEENLAEIMFKAGYQAAKQSMQGEALGWVWIIQHEQTGQIVNHGFSFDEIDTKAYRPVGLGYVFKARKVFTHAPDSAARIAEQDAEIARLTTELKEARKDVKRMDYLSNIDVTYRVLVQSQPSGDYVFDSCIVSGLRAAIDASLNIKGGEE